ncbi:MAG: hypothetical protein Q8M09_02585 [Pseudomonadota bacterium]|nr:hypothetical protein [Pseudomonadota bacterium]MDP2353697.1 hypothetical protein [Pseudomonadota bacterium]
MAACHRKRQEVDPTLSIIPGSEGTGDQKFDLAHLAAGTTPALGQFYTFSFD